MSFNFESSFEEIRAAVEESLAIDRLTEFQSNIAKSVLHCAEIAVKAANQSISAATDAKNAQERVDEATRTIVDALKETPVTKQVTVLPVPESKTPLAAKASTGASSQTIISTVDELHAAIRRFTYAALRNDILEYPRSKETASIVKQGLQRATIKLGSFESICIRCRIPCAFTDDASYTGLCKNCSDELNGIRKEVWSADGRNIIAKQILKDAERIDSAPKRIAYASSRLWRELGFIYHGDTPWSFDCIVCRGAFTVKDGFDGLCRDCKHRLSDVWLLPLDDRFQYSDPEETRAERIRSGTRFVWVVLSRYFYGVSWKRNGVIHVDDKVCVYVKNLSKNRVNNSDLERLREAGRSIHAQAYVLISLHTPIMKMEPYEMQMVEGHLEIYVASNDSAEIKTAVRLAYNANL